MNKLFSFLSYHNAIPIIAVVLTLGATSAFAATDPGAVFSQQQKVISVDNSYLVNKDLSSWTPTARITAVTEDADNYYVAYTFDTIALKNTAWQDVEEGLTLTVSKAVLGKSTDLGTYVAEKLKEQIAQESALLAQTQGIEQRSPSSAQVATVYGGLIGKLLTDTTQTLPGYTPVIAPSAPVVQAIAPPQSAAQAPGQSSAATPAGGAAIPPAASSSMLETASTDTASSSPSGEATTTGNATPSSIILTATTTNPTNTDAATSSALQ